MAVSVISSVIGDMIRRVIPLVVSHTAGWPGTQARNVSLYANQDWKYGGRAQREADHQLQHLGPWSDSQSSSADRTMVVTCLMYRKIDQSSP